MTVFLISDMVINCSGTHRIQTTRAKPSMCMTVLLALKAITCQMHDPNCLLLCISSSVSGMNPPDLTFNLTLSKAASTQPTLPSPPQTRTRHRWSGRSLQNCKADSGGTSWRSMTLKWMENGVHDQQIYRKIMVKNFPLEVNHSF